MSPGGPSEPAATVAAGSLDTLLAEALELAGRTRDTITEGGIRRAGARADPLAMLVRAGELGRITTLVTASVAWLLARLAVARGEIAPAEARAERWRLLPLDQPEPAPGRPADGELAALAAAADALYARIRRLDAALDSPPPLRH